jgi:hypothetical protein
MLRRRGVGIALAAAAAIFVVTQLATAGAEPGFSQATQIPQPFGGYGTYRSVSCVAAASCTAVGPFSLIAAGSKGTVITDDGGAWSRTFVPLPFGETGVSLNGVSCAAVGTCTAVGIVRNASGEQALVETESSGTWSAATIEPPGGGALAVLRHSVGDYLT